MVWAMSTKAQAILDEIKALPPEDREQVVDEAIRLRTGAQEWERQKSKLREMQSRQTGRGLFAGSGLLDALLADRAKERAGLAFQPAAS